ncbi:RNA polymerase sigma factor [Thalassotalea ganghwensis]
MIADNDLIARVVFNNDQHAFTSLVRKYQSPLRHFVRRLTAGDHALADDITQEAFLKVYQHIESFSGQSSFSTWAHKIAYHCFLRAKEKVHYQHEVFDLSEVLTMTQETVPENDIIIEKSMKSLSIEERTCITLSISAGMSHQEIVTITQLPLGTVKSHINRGKQKLIEKMQSQQANQGEYNE